MGQLETAERKAAAVLPRQYISVPTSAPAPVARPASEPSSSEKVVESVLVKDPTQTTIESFGSDLVTAIIKARVCHQTAHELIVTGTRYTAEMALAKRIVDHALPEADVLPKSIEIAAALASKADPAMQALKKGLYPHVLVALAGAMDGAGSAA